MNIYLPKITSPIPQNFLGNQTTPLPKNPKRDGLSPLYRGTPFLGRGRVPGILSSGDEEFWGGWVLGSKEAKKWQKLI